MATINGRVTDPAGRGISGAQVTATDGQTFGPVTSNGNGAYAIPNVADGQYVVTATALNFQDATINVTVQGGQDVQDADIQLTPVAITGVVTGADRAPLAGAQVSARDGQDQVVGQAQTGADGRYQLTVPPGVYRVQVDQPAGFLAARNVVVSPQATTAGIDFSLDVVHDFLGRIDDARFSLESPISELEAAQAVSLFSVVTLMLAGLSQTRVGEEEKTDILGVLRLFYRTSNGGLAGFTFADEGRLWGQIEGELGRLAKELVALQADLAFLNQEAKRQFNLGRSNGVVANVQFPVLFRRYVELGTDPLLALDLRREEQNQFFDKTRLAEADDRLKELKGVVLQLVRSLSKTGTASTRRVNEDWARFEAGALEVLATVAEYRVSGDQDEKNQWAVLAGLTGKDREREIAPYVVLARHGGKLLQYALQIYRETQDQLDNLDREHLRDLFQRPGTVYWTTRIREEATVVKRYPLPNWA